jgi:acetylglutamate kinase
VVATVGRDADGRERNVNADLAAGAIAAALGASKLVYLTDVPGLYLDFGDPDKQALMSEVTVDRLAAMLDADELHEGMRPEGPLDRRRDPPTACRRPTSSTAACCTPC